MSMSNSNLEETSVDEEVLRKVQQRVLEAEKEKLNLDIAIGINNDIEEIIRESVD